MGACAEVDKLSLLVEADGLALTGVLLSELYLVRLAELLEEGKSVLRSLLKAADLDAGLDDLLHLGFDLSYIIGVKGLLDVEVIVKALVDGRTDGELSVGIQALDSLSEDMRGRVPESLLALVIVEGQQFKLTVSGKLGTQIAHLAVHHSGAAILVQSH